MNTNMLRTIAASAVLALSLLAGGATAPALADDPVEFVCFDQVQPDGTTEVVCEPASLVAETCEKGDPDDTTPECKVVKQLRPQREWVVPASLSDSEEGGQGGGGSEPLDLHITN